MGKFTIRMERRSKKAQWLRLLFLLLPITVAGCVMNGQGGTSAQDTIALWKSRDQFVRLEPQGPGGHRFLPNDQPADLSENRIRHALGRIEIQRLDLNTPVPLFTNEELDTLSKNLAKGLAQASPKEDVTLAVIGMHPGVFTLERRLTTGRTFFRNGKLHMILGEVHARFDEGEDRRLHPFIPGARRQTDAQTWRLMEKPGIRLFQEDGNPRPGWLELDLEKIDQAALESEPVGHKEEMREEQRKQAGTPPTETRNLTDRLRMLKQLRREDLIGEEEYREKKREILEGL